MKNFAFRVTSSYDVTVEHLTPLYELCEKVAIYQHDADDEIERTHIHGLLIGCSKGEDTIRNRFFKGKYQSADYELKTKYVVKEGIMQVKRTYDVDEKYIIYMSKGVLDPMFLKVFTKEETDAYKAQWKNHREKKEDPSERKKKKPINMFEACRQIVEDELKYKIDETQVRLPWRYSQQEVVEAIIDWSNKNGKPVVAYKCRDYYDCILQQYDPKQYVGIVMNLIFKRDRVSG
jgi:hypothetical protein